MVPPQNYVDIPDSKVAVDDFSRFSEEEIDQRLEFRWFRVGDDSNEDEEMEALRLALIDALEIRITREDPEANVEQIEFTWDILSYSQRYIKI